jgi:uncharacterized membrane protein
MKTLKYIALWFGVPLLFTIAAGLIHRFVTPLTFVWVFLIILVGATIGTWMMERSIQKDRQRKQE